MLQKWMPTLGDAVAPLIPGVVGSPLGGPRRGDGEGSGGAIGSPSAPCACAAAALALPPPRPRILIVEDCQIALAAMQQLLERLGFCVDAHVDGESAMTQLALLPPRYVLVVLDLQLPGMSGYAVASWYREHVRSAAARPPWVVAISADPDVDACRDYGFDRCLPKPLTAEVVAMLSRQLLAVSAPRP